MYILKRYVPRLLARRFASHGGLKHPEILGCELGEHGAPRLGLGERERCRLEMGKVCGGR